ncbi:PEP/pyruvate-binding domain-containing protein [Spirillospora sp. CA-294931]|uniref:PEP/pyruvate-binding domain-containing protein n=1 Tax=Spirillospora sp. CA-294931 TaxID=3240042 RepID=UPI003D8A81E9
MTDAWTLPLADAHADPARAGGKGASLARLAAAGLPVPDGFHVTTDAYRRFVERDGLYSRVMAAVAEVVPDLPGTAQAAASRIAELFARQDVPDEVAAAVRAAYAALGGDEPVAVRSSATAEDRPGISFAGQQDTFLGIDGGDALVDAVRRCWASLWTARAIAYRARNGVDHRDVALAVVVQRLVPAEAAGVLFTVAPTGGAADQIVINAAWGLGEAVVSGRVTPDAFVIEKGTGRLAGQRISAKTVMTVPSGHGTREEPVPDRLREAPVLTTDQAVELARLGERIERLYGRPMDVEWAHGGGRPYVLQARPITGLSPTATGDDAEEWNDSLAGEYLWTNGNLGEAVPDVMTPCTWSLMQIFMGETMPAASLPDHRAYGTIGGRFYMNLSVAATLASAFGTPSRIGTLEQAFGKLPPGLEIPLVPVARWDVVRALGPVAARSLVRVRANQRRLPDFLASAPGRCDALRDRVAELSTPFEMIELWHEVLLPLLTEACHMLEAAGRLGGGALVTVRDDLERLVGESDANAMLSGLGDRDTALASLGPMTGLARLARGEIDRAAYIREWGHRGPHEFEVSTPRPAEDPAWIDARAAALGGTERDAGDLLMRQREAGRDAWRRFRARHPGKVAATRRRIGRWARAAHAREAARSEVVRVFWVIRAFVLRAGEMTGRGDDLFQLTIDEILGLLGTDERPLRRIPARRRAYERYRELPAYPALILGRFDPFAWAAEPGRRTDFYDGTGRETTEVPDSVSGFPGAAGIVEGTVRVLRSPEEGDRLEPGEILVTTVTNIGWTPLFPRAAAVVTDVGAPLSHAAIVARELGIPAVVGCGNATMRLRDGDRVRVDGARGTVTPLSGRPSTEGSPRPASTVIGHHKADG